MLKIGEDAHYSCQSSPSNPASDIVFILLDQDGKKIPTKETKMKKSQGNGFVTGSIHSFGITKGMKKLFMECRAINKVGMALKDKTVTVSCT